MKNSVTLVIDANNFIAVASHANPTLTAPDGTPSGGLYSSLRMLRTILRLELDDPVDRIYMVYDAGRPAFRTELCPTYKGERDKRRQRGDDAFYENYTYQTRRSKVLYRHLGAIIAEASGFEADDLVAGIVRHLGDDRRIVIVSGDKDMRQLVRKNVQVYLPTQHTFISRADVPRGYRLMRCLTGDKSDNIPGVGGIGDVYAAKIVGSMPRPYTPSSLRKHLKHRPVDRFTEKLTASMDIVKRNWRVMNLSITAEESFATATFRHAPSLKKFKSICHELAFKSIIRDPFLFGKLGRELKGHVL